MQRVDASKLIELCVTVSKKPALRFILSDEVVFRKLITQALTDVTSGQQPRSFVGKTAVAEFVDYFSSAGLFGEAQAATVELAQKLSAKQWNEDLTALRRLPKDLPGHAVLFSNPASRGVFKDADMQPLTSQVYLCYTPSDADALKCAEMLASRYSLVKAKGVRETTTMCASALEHYSNDLSLVDAHFERMEKGRLPFEEALQGHAEVGSFSVVDALSRADKALLELRIQQCAQVGEEASGILSAVVYFLKQVVALQAALQTTPNFKVVCESLGVPYPSQARLQRAVKNLPQAPENYARFFFCAPELELSLRQSRTPYAWLGVELSRLIP